MNTFYSRLLIPALAVGLGCSARGTGPRAAPASIKILEPNPFPLEIGTTARLSANVFDSSGAAINAEVRIAWSSTDTTVVRVDASGTLTPVKLGYTPIFAVVDANSARVEDSIFVDVFGGTVVDRLPTRAGVHQ